MDRNTVECLYLLIPQLEKIIALTQEERAIEVNGRPETVASHVLIMHQIYAYTHVYLPSHLDKFEISLEITVHDNGEAINGDKRNKTAEERKLEIDAGITLAEGFKHVEDSYIASMQKLSEESLVVKSLDILQGTLAIFMTKGEHFRKHNRTYRQEQAMFPIPDCNNIYTRMIVYLREEMNRRGYFSPEV